MIKGILFDYDGTLTKRYESAYHMYQWVLSHFTDEDIHSLAFEARVQRCMIWDQFGQTDKAYVLEHIRDTWYPELDVKEWKMRWYENFARFQVLMPDSIEVLKELKKHYKLGILSNGESVSQHAKITAMGLDEIFDYVTVSGDYGIHKPDPKIFEIAAENLGLECEECAMVGDTFYADIVGAIETGMTPVWTSFEREYATDLEIPSAKNYQDLKKMFLEDTSWM